MNYYVEINNPIRIGERVCVVPLGQTRTTERGRTEALGRCITPNSGLTDVWFSKKDICNQ